MDYDYVQSEGFGSVERLAKILANNGYRTIVIVGGDGALNDAINGKGSVKQSTRLGTIKMKDVYKRQAERTIVRQYPPLTNRQGC